MEGVRRQTGDLVVAFTSRDDMVRLSDPHRAECVLVSTLYTNPEAWSLEPGAFRAFASLLIGHLQTKDCVSDLRAQHVSTALPCWCLGTRVS